MHTIRAFVFDLDDTLFPERQFAFSGFDAVARAFEPILGPRDPAAARMRELFDTEHRRRVFDVLLAEKGVVAPPPVVAAMVDAYRAHVPRITLFPDADDALSRLRTTFRLGLITDGPSTMQWSKIAALGLRGRVDAILVTDDFGPGFAKPHTRSFEQMAERLHAAHAECVYVADNAAKDFIAPRRLGWKTVRVQRADGVYRDAAAPPGGEPDDVVTTLENLERLAKVR